MTDDLTTLQVADSDAAEPTQGMYLSTLQINNFRTCVETEIEFRPDLTLIVGENNSGKSNIIDALRLATSPLSGRRMRYFESDDLSLGARRDIIELTTSFDDLTSAQRGRFSAAYDLETERAWYTVRHDPDDTRLARLRTVHIAGKYDVPDTEPESREKINHVYLEPLRDAQRALDSAASPRIGQIIKYLTAPEAQADFVDKANKGMRNLESHPVVIDTATEIQSHVQKLTDPVRAQNVGLSFNDFKLHRLARSLRLKMSESGIELSDLADSGLGYANLAYIATVILELRNAAESELTLFLVEEPEAHLHPQLQATLLEYLREQARRSTQPDQDRAAGRIQVIATTHSPNLACAVGTSNIVALRSGKLPTESGAPATPNTVAIMLSKIPLTRDERRKVDQYLDATRAELLFGKRSLLVEGLAEAVLLPAIASDVVLRGLENEKYRRFFRAVSIINVGSVDFAPYVRLLTYEIGGVRLADFVGVITDRDPRWVENPESGEIEEVSSNRKVTLEAQITELDAADIAKVYEAAFTLEADLLEPTNQNAEVIHQAFKNQKPQSEHVWESFISDEWPARAFYRKMQDYKGDYLRKGEFAHDVASLIRDGGTFECPPYLKSAILDAIGHAFE